MAQNKSLTVNFFGRDVSLNRTLDGIKKNTFATSNVLEQASRKATLAIGALSAAAITFVKAAAEDEKSAMSLANTLKTVTGATNAQIANVEKFISKAEMFSTVADDKIRPAFDTLVRSTGNVTKSQQMLSLALEIAQKEGVDVGQVTDAMAKASRGQFKALTNLTKIAPKATKANTVYGSSMKIVNNQLETVQKTMGKTQKSTESLESYTKRLEKAYNGSIKAISGTTSYQMGQMRVAFDHVKEQLGYALMPYMMRLTKWLKDHEKDIPSWTDNIFKWGKALFFVAVGIKALNGAYKAFQISKAIAAFITLGTTATAAGASAASAGAVAAAGWAWLAAAVIGTTALVKLLNDIEAKRKAKLYNPNKIPSWSSESNKFYAGTSMSDASKKPRLAAGGIVTRPTNAIIGEAGPEAVLPLSRAGLGLGGLMIVNHIQGSVVTQQELSLSIRNDMAQFLRRKGLNPAILGV